MPARRQPGRHQLWQDWQKNKFELRGLMYTILLVVLILMLLGALPAWPYSRSWGYYPSGGLGLIVVVVLVLLLAGRL
jgi:Protein of unknown function (DUF3309)